MYARRGGPGSAYGGGGGVYKISALSASARIGARKHTQTRILRTSGRRTQREIYSGGNPES